MCARGVRIGSHRRQFLARRSLCKDFFRRAPSNETHSSFTLTCYTSRSSQQNQLQTHSSFSPTSNSTRSALQNRYQAFYSEATDGPESASPPACSEEPATGSSTDIHTPIPPNAVPTDVPVLSTSTPDVQPQITPNVEGTLLLYYQNLGGINTSLSDYTLAISDAAYDLYAFTETWLNENTNSYQLFGPEYSVYRGDRTALNSNKRSGGGVLLAVRSRFKSHQLHPPNCSALEQIWVVLPLEAHSLFICVIYIPPDRVNDPELIDQHTATLIWVCSKLRANDTLLLIGDYNLPNICWTRCPAGYLYPDMSRSSANLLTLRLLDEYSTANVRQLCDIRNTNNRILDLCFASSDAKISVEAAPSPLVKHCRHHPALLISLDCSALSFVEVSSEFYADFHNGNYDEMNVFLTSIDWDALLADGADHAAESFSRILAGSIQTFVPIRRSRTQHYPPWTNSYLRRLKTAKRSALSAYAKYRRSRQPNRARFRHLKTRYKTANHRYHHTNKRLYAFYIRRTQIKLKHKPKQFWTYVNQQRRESGLPRTMFRDDAEASSPADICSLFRDQFSSVFTDEQLSDDQVNEAANRVPLRPPIGPHPTIDAEDVRRACCKLKNSTSFGPDGIPALVLKKCSDSLACPLARIFNLSLCSGVFPSCWKKSFVFPVHKKGCKRDIRNYRGVAALCAVSKLFEVVVLNYFQFNTKSYIAAEQHGFVAKRSTSSNLVTYTSFIVRAIQQGHQVDAVYTDMSAAFDKINHRIATAKMSRIGFVGPFLAWIRSYLTGREMCVKLGDVTSAPFIVFSGVQQGSHLGPPIYLVYMNDVHPQLNCNKLSFADDIKLFTIVRDPSDSALLQQQIDVFSNWCTANRMVLNSSKCSVITFSRKRTPVHHCYTLNNTILTRTTTIKDLGVLLDSKLSFSDHISYITSKASRSLGFIFRIAKDFTQISCLKTLYCSLVRSTLEYCSVVWAPFYQNSIQRIESIQRKFTRFALRRTTRENGDNAPDYFQRCETIGLNLLSTRRDVAKATFVADLIQNNVDCQDLLQQLNLNGRNRTLRSHTFLRIPRARTNYGHNEPVSSMCRVFNSCSDLFDFHLSRSTHKQLFTRHFVTLDTQN